MNVFEKFSLSREIAMREGEIVLDQQRILMFPVEFLGTYAFNLRDKPEQAYKLYEAMKKGQIAFSIAIGKAYLLDYKTFLDRWIKYCEFAGWGIVTYQLIENDGKYGFLQIKNLPMHQYLKAKGVTEPFDVLFEGLIAGSASGTFKANLDVVETQCVCSGNDVCVYYWGTKDQLLEKFPNISSKRFGVRP